MIKLFYSLFFALLIISCSYTGALRSNFDTTTIPEQPNYSDSYYWSALPDKKDYADHVPEKNAPAGLIDNQAHADADVFYIHPSTYFGKNNWNADLHDEKINTATDEKAVQNQATVFNGSCRVFAPRYRQVSYRAYFHLDDSDARQAFNLAYSDIKTAFQYYLDHYNNGRPIIIAGHSQGTTMAEWLLRDFFDGKPLQKKLVCAYIPGMPIYTNTFTYIPAGDSATQINCYVSWRTYITGNGPKIATPLSENIVVINPLSWTTENTLSDKTKNIGGLGRDANTIYTHVCTAQIHNDILWVSRPDIPGKLFIPKNLHPADYNLYWMNIRDNVAQRIDAYNKIYSK